MESMLLILIPLMVAFAVIPSFRRGSAIGKRSGGWEIPPSIRRWTLAGGILLTALPGAITVAALYLGGGPSVPLPGKEGFLVPAGKPVSLPEARGFLARGWTVINGNEENPVDFFQGLVPLGGRRTFRLDGGATLTIGLKRGTVPPKKKPSVECDYTLRCTALTQDGAGFLEEPAGSSLEPDFLLFRKVIEREKIDLAPFGGLLSSGEMPAKTHLFLVPLEKDKACKRVPAAGWWAAHGKKVAALLEADLSPRERRWMTSGSESTLDFFSGFVTGSGLLLLGAGALLLLFTSTHKVRFLCLFLIFSVVYAGAVDLWAVKKETKHLLDPDHSVAARAAVAAAATRMHPVTAAKALLDAGREGKEEEIRAIAIRCLDRPLMRDALKRIDGAGESLREIAATGGKSVREAARRILKLMEKSRP